MKQAAHMEEVLAQPFPVFVPFSRCVVLCYERWSSLASYCWFYASAVKLFVRHLHGKASSTEKSTMQGCQNINHVKISGNLAVRSQELLKGQTSIQYSLQKALRSTRRIFFFLMLSSSSIFNTQKKGKTGSYVWGRGVCFSFFFFL